MKKKSTGDHRNCSFSEEEIEVSHVLLDLPKLVFKSETLRSLSVRVPMRRRSSLAGTVNSSTKSKNSPQRIAPLSQFPISSVDSGSGHRNLKPSTNPNPVLKLKCVRSCTNVKNPSFHVDLEVCSSNKQLQIRSPYESPKERKNVVFDFDLNQAWQPTTTDHDPYYPQEDEKQETKQQQLSTTTTKSYSTGGGMDLCAAEFGDVNILLREHYRRKTAEARRNRTMKMRGKKYLKLSLSSQITVL